MLYNHISPEATQHKANASVKLSKL